VPRCPIAGDANDSTYNNNNCATGAATLCGATVWPRCAMATNGFGRSTLSTIKQQEAQLSQRDRATRCVSEFVLFHEIWELERFIL